MGRRQGLVSQHPPGAMSATGRRVVHVHRDGPRDDAFVVHPAARAVAQRCLPEAVSMSTASAKLLKTTVPSSNGGPSAPASAERRHHNLDDRAPAARSGSIMMLRDSA